MLFQNKIVILDKQQTYPFNSNPTIYFIISNEQNTNADTNSNNEVIQKKEEQIKLEEVERQKRIEVERQQKQEEEKKKKQLEV